MTRPIAQYPIRGNYNLNPKCDANNKIVLCCVDGECLDFDSEQACINVGGTPHVFDKPDIDFDLLLNNIGYNLVEEPGASLISEITDGAAEIEDLQSLKFYFFPGSNVLFAGQGVPIPAGKYLEIKKKFLIPCPIRKNANRISPLLWDPPEEAPVFDENIGKWKNPVTGILEFDGFFTLNDFIEDIQTYVYGIVFDINTSDTQYISGNNLPNSLTQIDVRDIYWHDYWIFDWQVINNNWQYVGHIARYNNDYYVLLRDKKTWKKVTVGIMKNCEDNGDEVCPSSTPAPSPSPVSRAFTVTCPITVDLQEKTDIVITNITNSGVISAGLDSYFYIGTPDYSGCASISALNPYLPDFESSPYTIGIYPAASVSPFTPYPSGEASCLSDHPCPS